MPTKLIEQQVQKSDLLDLELKSKYGALVKVVVDVKRAVMIAGMTMHSDGEEILLESGSEQADLWGINLPFYDGDRVCQILQRVLKNTKEVALLGHVGPISTALPNFHSRGNKPFENSEDSDVTLDHEPIQKSLRNLPEKISGIGSYLCLARNLCHYKWYRTKPN
jgi:hypothetical protein